mmetsp:Transcript_90716/g.259527  ORF Transcript_90716/g.259527 Transcript_90716/m.259527 type:complete len:212 (-) Transcript_90716:316-951(-)
MGLVVVGDELISSFLDLHEPSRNCPVDERRFRTPTMRVVVHFHSAVYQVPIFLQHLLDVLIGRLDILPLEVHNIGKEATTIVDGLQHACSVFLNDAEFYAHPVIVLSEGRRLVDDASTSCGRHVLVGHDMPDLVHAVFELFLEVWEERLVLDAHKLCTHDLFEDFKVRYGVLLDGRADPSPTVFADDPLLTVSLLLHTQIRELGVYAKRKV